MKIFVSLMRTNQILMNFELFFLIKFTIKLFKSKIYSKKNYLNNKNIDIMNIYNKITSLKISKKIWKY